MTAHTPGPGILEFPNGNWVSEVFIRAHEWGCIARIGLSYSVPHWDEPQRANAVLIAAAPDLLAALKAIVGSLASQDDDGLLEYANEMIAARAAIKKAEGP